MKLRDSDFDEDYDEPSDEDEGGEEEDEEAADFALPPRERPLWLDAAGLAFANDCDRRFLRDYLT